MKSPYENIDSSEWQKITETLLNDFPLSKDYLVSLVLKSWDAILRTKIADKWSIAQDVQPKPQIMGFFLHEIIGQYIQADYPKSWRKEKTAADKDVVCITNPDFSLEIKTSSDKNKIFGNRSYAQEEKQGGKKSKSGYYLAINFEKFEETEELPEDGEESTEESTEEPEEQPAQPDNPMGTYIVLGIIAVIGIGAGYYFKVVKKKKEQFLDEDDEEDEEEEVLEDEDETEDTEDDFFEKDDEEDE